MEGYKTWLAVIVSLGVGVYLIINGETEGGVALIIFGFSLLGIGSKLDKIKRNL